MVSFDAVAGDYEAARPSYPDGVYDALPPLADALVVEGGAGTGIATRQLRARGARVVATDIGAAMLGRADGMRVLMDGAHAAIRDGCADLVCFAQCWHWLDPDRRSAEAARVLRDGGTWAGWWNHMRADGEPWFEAFFDLLEAECGARREHRDTDWGASLDQARFAPPMFTSVPWVREISIEQFLVNERSMSYVGLTPDGERVLGAIEAILRDAFGDGPVRCRYETWLWQATKR
jgi:SAM-dependent methyltransferase